MFISAPVTSVKTCYLKGKSDTFDTLLVGMQWAEAQNGLCLWSHLANFFTNKRFLSVSASLVLCDSKSFRFPFLVLQIMLVVLQICFVFGFHRGLKFKSLSSFSHLQFRLGYGLGAQFMTQCLLKPL